MVLGLERHTPLAIPDTANAAPLMPLTTWEGWRDFCLTEVGVPELLSDRQRRSSSAQTLAADRQRRRDYHAGLEIVAQTTALQSAIGLALGNLGFNQNRRTDRLHLLVSGHSGTGKTTILLQLGRAIELAWREHHANWDGGAPVIYARLPSNATPKGTLLRISHFCALSFPARITEEQLKEEIADALRQLGTVLICWDEVQRLNLMQRQDAAAADAIRDLTQELGVTMVMAGIDLETSGLLRGARGAQIMRTSRRRQLHYYRAGRRADREEWRGIVDLYDKALRLHAHHPGDLTQHADLLLGRCAGMLGALKILVCSAAAAAVASGRERITAGALQNTVPDLLAEEARRQDRPS